MFVKEDITCLNNYWVRTKTLSDSYYILCEDFWNILSDGFRVQEVHWRSMPIGNNKKEERRLATIKQFVIVFRQSTVI